MGSVTCPLLAVCFDFLVAMVLVASKVKIYVFKTFGYLYCALK